MSVSLYYSPLGGEHWAGSGSRTKEALEKAFGPFPLRLSEADGHDSTLDIMYAASGDEAYRKLSEAVEQHGSITVTAVY